MNEPLTADEQIGLIKRSLADGLVLDRFVGSVPVFRRSTSDSPDLVAALDDAIHALSGGDLAAGLVAVHVARERLGSKP